MATYYCWSAFAVVATIAWIAICIHFGAAENIWWHICMLAGELVTFGLPFGYGAWKAGFFS